MGDFQWVGERGPELMTVPPGGVRIIPNSQIRKNDTEGGES